MLMLSKMMSISRARKDDNITGADQERSVLCEWNWLAAITTMTALLTTLLQLNVFGHCPHSCLVEMIGFVDDTDGGNIAQVRMSIFPAKNSFM